MDTIKNLFTSERKNRNIIILILIALIILGGAYFLFGKKALAPGKLDEKTEGTSVEGTVSPLIQVMDQIPGKVVNIDSLTLDTPGWVAIYNDNEGEPSVILGAGWFDTGTHTNVQVESFVDLAPGNTYYAVLHKDDGVLAPDAFGSHPFNLETDLPITDGLTNLWVMSAFKIQSIGSRG